MYISKSQFPISAKLAKKVTVSSLVHISIENYSMQKHKLQKVPAWACFNLPRKGDSTLHTYALQRNKEEPKAVKSTFGSTALGSWITTSEPYWGLSASPVNTAHVCIKLHYKSDRACLIEVYPENVKAGPDIVGSVLIENTNKRYCLVCYTSTKDITVHGMQCDKIDIWSQFSVPR